MPVAAGAAEACPGPAEQWQEGKRSRIDPDTTARATPGRPSPPCHHDPARLSLQHGARGDPHTKLHPHSFRDGFTVY
jgi:hypothetical protein